MNFGTLITLIILAAVVGLAVRSIYKSKKNSKGCSGNCMSCNHGCH